MHNLVTNFSVASNIYTQIKNAITKKYNQAVFNNPDIAPREALEKTVLRKFGLIKSREDENPFDLFHLSDEELRNFKNNKDMEMLPIISIIAKTAIPLTGTMIACRSAIAGDYFTAAFLASGSYALYKTFDHGVNKELAGVRQKLLNVKPSENSVAPSTSP